MLTQCFPCVLSPRSVIFIATFFWLFFIYVCLKTNSEIRLISLIRLLIETFSRNQKKTIFLNLLPNYNCSWLFEEERKRKIWVIFCCCCCYLLKYYTNNEQNPCDETFLFKIMWRVWFFILRGKLYKNFIQKTLFFSSSFFILSLHTFHIIIEIMSNVFISNRDVKYWF